MALETGDPKPAIAKRPSSRRASPIWFVLRVLGLTALFAAVAGGLVWALFPHESYGDKARLVTYAGLGVLALVVLFELPKAIRMATSRRGAVGAGVFVQIALATAIAVGINVFAFEHYRRFDLTWDHAFTLKPELREQLAQLRGDTDIVIVQRNLANDLAGDATPDRYDVAAPKKIVEKVRDLAEQFADLGPRFRVQTLDIQDDDFDKKVDAIAAAEKSDAEARGDPAKSPLADAIRASSRNSIFFRSGGKVQRLGFNDIYQVDKDASAKANDGQGNLVLAYQGVEPFARKILNIEEKTPKVAVAVVHPLLATKNIEVPGFSLNGARIALERHGVDVKDVMLRKPDPDGALSEDPSAETFDENRFEFIEEALKPFQEAIEQLGKVSETRNEELKFWTETPLLKLQEKYVYIILPNQRGIAQRSMIDELERRKIAYRELPFAERNRDDRVNALKAEVEAIESDLDRLRKMRDELVEERAKLDVGEIVERRRIGDVGVKMNRMLADADLLVIPRQTSKSNSVGIWTNVKEIHKLDPLQIRAIRQFMAAGKPVLFLLGPNGQKTDRDSLALEEDPLESLLADLKIRLPSQTILFNVEVKEFTERQQAFGVSDRKTTLPPLAIEWEPGTGKIGGKRDDALVAGDPHPLRVSLSAVARAVASRLTDLQTRHPRPVYVEIDVRAADKVDAVAALAAETGLVLGASLPSKIVAGGLLGLTAKKVAPWGIGSFDEAAVFLMTTSEGWNQPGAITVRETPRFVPTPEGADDKNTIHEIRSGPFPVAVAIDRKAPRAWIEPSPQLVASGVASMALGEVGSDLFNLAAAETIYDRETPNVRIGVIGSGTVFTGASLEPVREKLLVDVCNWLLSRDDLLARQQETWSYPRVGLDENQRELWRWGTLFGLPLAFLYLGVLVWFVRRLR